MEVTIGGEAATRWDLTRTRHCGLSRRESQAADHDARSSTYLSARVPSTTKSGPSGHFLLAGVHVMRLAGQPLYAMLTQPVSGRRAALKPPESRDFGFLNHGKDEYDASSSLGPQLRLGIRLDPGTSTFARRCVVRPRDPHKKNRGRLGMSSIPGAANDTGRAPASSWVSRWLRTVLSVNVRQQTAEDKEKPSINHAGSLGAAEARGLRP